MNAADGRVTNYDAIAEQFDRRYSLYRYDGIRDDPRYQDILRRMHLTP